MFFYFKVVLDDEGDQSNNVSEAPAILGSEDVANAATVTDPLPDIDNLTNISSMTAVPLVNSH